jgi:deoxyribonucleoside regulator
MPDEKDPDLELMIKVAWQYYFRNLTQQEIAEKLNLSRLKIGRILRKALAEGVIEIRLSSSIQSYNLPIETELETRFLLREALVVNSADDSQTLYDNLGMAGARYLERLIEPNFILGIGLGTTVNAIVPHLGARKSKNGTIVTLTGGFSQAGHDTSGYNASWPLANLLGANLEQLYCPLVTQNKEGRDAILQDGYLSGQLKRATESKIALVSVGYIHMDMPLHRLGFCERADVEHLKAAGAVGELLVNFFDINGNPVRTNLTDRMIGLGIEDLKKIPTTVVISGGVEKAAAILGALRSGCVKVLITDQKTAQTILDLDDQTRK